MREEAGEEGSSDKGRPILRTLPKVEVMSWRAREMAWNWICCRVSSAQRRGRASKMLASPRSFLLERGRARFLRKDRAAWRS